MAIHEIARRAGRDVCAVHSDIHVLLRAGVLEKAAKGGVVFPYDAIHVERLRQSGELTQSYPKTSGSSHHLEGMFLGYLKPTEVKKT